MNSPSEISFDRQLPWKRSSTPWWVAAANTSPAKTVASASPSLPSKVLPITGVVTSPRTAWAQHGISGSLEFLLKRTARITAEGVAAVRLFLADGRALTHPQCLSDFITGGGGGNTTHAASSHPHQELWKSTLKNIKRCRERTAGSRRPRRPAQF